MGIYLGQIPPAEIARFKAELAETLIANFCYPRFFDHRTESLQMRPIDRTKRQDVWLYLSSFDFTAWNRVDLMSPDLQLQIERLFIQFMQRNRSFFGNQGRRRMPDVRMLISSCATAVAQSLRNHLTQRPNNPPFGSPRAVVTWSSNPISEKAVPGWEQISASTMTLQQQLQELRGEIKVPVASDGRQPPSPSQGVSTMGARRSTGTRPQAAVLPAPNGNGIGSADFDRVITQQPTAPTPPVGRRPAAQVVSPVPQTPGSSARRGEPYVAPADSPVAHRRSEAVAVSTEAPARKSGTLVSPAEQQKPGRKSESLAAAVASFAASAPPASSAPMGRAGTSPLSDNGTGSTSLSQRTVPSKSVATSANGPDVMSVGEDDIAIFEQMRHQLVLWLRLEVVTAGLEIGGQGPAQLLEMLRQQSRHDETRLQVVSTLLNLANQVIKTGVVSVLDYKQALMFLLMHTRRP
jgi:hypothetical protein